MSAILNKKLYHCLLALTIHKKETEQGNTIRRRKKGAMEKLRNVHKQREKDESYIEVANPPDWLHLEKIP